MYGFPLPHHFIHGSVSTFKHYDLSLSKTKITKQRQQIFFLYLALMPHETTSLRRENRFLYSVFHFSWNYALLCHCVVTSISCRQWPGKFLDLEVEYLYGRFWTPGTYFVNESPSIRSSKFRWLPSTAKHTVTTRNINMRVTEDGSFLFVER